MLPIKRIFFYLQNEQGGSKMNTEFKENLYKNLKMCSDVIMEKGNGLFGHSKQIEIISP